MRLIERISIRVFAKLKRNEKRDKGAAKGRKFYFLSTGRKLASTQSRHFHFLSDGSDIAREISRPSVYPAPPSPKISSRMRSCTRRSYNFTSELRAPLAVKFRSDARLKSLAFYTTKALYGMFTHYHPFSYQLNRMQLT